MDFSKISDKDLVALKNGDYSKLSDEGLKEIREQSLVHQSSAAMPEDVRNEPGLIAKPLMIPEEVPAQGLGAIGDFASGKGLQQASQTAQGQAPTSIAGKIGEGIGTMISPSNIAMAGIMGGLIPKGTAQAMGQTAGKALDIIAAPTKAVASAAYGNAVKEAGLSLPGELLDTPTAKQKVIEYAEGLHPLLDATPEKINQMMEPQGIYRLYKQIGDILDNTKIANMAKDVRQVVPKQVNADLLQIRQLLGNAIKLAKPGMAEAMANYGNTQTRAAALRTLGQVVAKAAPYGIGAAAITGLRHLGGQ